MKKHNFYAGPSILPQFTIDKVAEAVMLLASRIDNTTRLIKNGLATKDFVLADRYYPSWLAYQQVRLSSLFPTSKAEIFLNQLQSIVTAFNLILKPDKIIFLQGKPEIFAQRIKSRDKKKKSKYDNLKFPYQVAKTYTKILTNELW